MSTRLQKNCAEIIALFLVELCNKSLLSGSVPSAKSRKFTSIHKVFSYAFYTAAQEGRLWSGFRTMHVLYRQTSNLSVLSMARGLRFLAPSRLHYGGRNYTWTAVDYRPLHCIKTAELKVLPPSCVHWILVSWIRSLCLTCSQRLTVEHAIILQRLLRHRVILVVVYSVGSRLAAQWLRVCAAAWLTHVRRCCYS